MTFRRWWAWRKEVRALRRDVAFAYWQWRDAGYLYQDMHVIYDGRKWPEGRWLGVSDDLKEKSDTYQELRRQLDRLEER